MSRTEDSKSPMFSDVLSKLKKISLYLFKCNFILFVIYNLLKKLNLERLTVRLGLTVIYFPIFRQVRPDLFRECLQLRKDVTVS